MRRPRSSARAEARAARSARAAAGRRRSRRSRTAAPLSPGRTPVPPIRTELVRDPSAFAISCCSPAVGGAAASTRSAPRPACALAALVARGAELRAADHRAAVGVLVEVGGKLLERPSSSDCEYLPSSTPSSLQSRITLGRAGVGRRAPRAARAAQHGGEGDRGCSHCEHRVSRWAATSNEASPHQYTNPRGRPRCGAPARSRRVDEPRDRGRQCPPRPCGLQGAVPLHDLERLARARCRAVPGRNSAISATAAPRS